MKAETACPCNMSWPDATLFLRVAPKQETFQAGCKAPHHYHQKPGSARSGFTPAKHPFPFAACDWHAGMATGASSWAPRSTWALAFASCSMISMPRPAVAGAREGNRFVLSPASSSSHAHTHSLSPYYIYMCAHAHLLLYTHKRRPHERPFCTLYFLLYIHVICVYTHRGRIAHCMYVYRT